jgi:hypothetical protein
MYAETLPQLIQDHRGQIVSGAIDRVRLEPELAGLIDSRCDVAAWFHRIIEALDRWPGIATDNQAERLHLAFGEACARNAIPLHQLLRALHLLKSRIVDFARSQGMARNALEIYVEEELENRVSFFFDWVLYQVVLGYESVRPLQLDKPQAPGTPDMRDLPGWVPL